MGYQQRTRSRRSSGRGYGRSRREKTKAKGKGQKHHSSGRYISEESGAWTREEVADRTLNGLHNLGNQRFAVFPFDEYFGSWLVDLKELLSEFESSSTVSIDNVFMKERSQILSNVELELEEIRHERISRDEAAKNLSDNKLLLERMKEEYTTRKEKIEWQKNSEIKHLSNSVDNLKRELDRIVRMKTGLFRGISKKAKEQKEAEATQRLNSEQKKLASAIEHFDAEQEKLRIEYERKEQPIIDKVREQQKEVEKQEIDWSLEARRAACEALANAVSTVLQRKGSSSN
jgi:hypothetical protein